MKTISKIDRYCIKNKKTNAVEEQSKQIRQIVSYLFFQNTIFQIICYHIFLFSKFNLH